DGLDVLRGCRSAILGVLDKLCPCFWRVTELGQVERHDLPLMFAADMRAGQRSLRPARLLRKAIGGARCGTGNLRFHAARAGPATSGRRAAAIGRRLIQTMSTAEAKPGRLRAGPVANHPEET